MPGDTGCVRSSHQTATAAESSRAAPTPDATARPSVKASRAGSSSRSACSAGSDCAAWIALGSESLACVAISAGRLGGTDTVRYTAVRIEPKVAMPSAMPSS